MNFSISGSTTNVRDAVEIAFMYAADAGIFVAASAGNSGPTTSTVAHPGPWLTTVAAGTHNRNGTGSVTLGNGATYTGASVATAVGPAPLIDSSPPACPAPTPRSSRSATARRTAPSSSIPPRWRARSWSASAASPPASTRAWPSRKPAEWAWSCSTAPTARSTPTSTSSRRCTCRTPTAPPSRPTRRLLGATATINQATIVYNVPAPFTASFSSRGPLRAAGGDLLKPDVIAPGQDILAAVAPPGNAGRDFDLYSGTSMSSPHVAGLAALLKDLHPTWSPMAIKSALMTTAYDVLDGPNTNPLVIFRQGAGHVAPNSAADPGLVYNSSWNDWLAFICATQPQGLTSTCDALWGAGYSKNASDLNTASIAIGDLAGVETVTRTVTNVGDAAAPTRPATRDGGFTVVRQPGHLHAQPRRRPSRFTVTLTRTAAPLNAYTGGQLTWTDGTHSVRIPMVVRPVALAAPAEVTGSYSVTFGYNGPFTATARGLVPAAVTPGTVADDPTDGTCSLTSPNAAADPGRRPGRDHYARFSLFDADVNAGSRPRPVRVQQRRHSRRLERLRHLGRGGQSAQPGRRYLHRRRPGLGRRRHRRRSSSTPGCSARPRPAT